MSHTVRTRASRRRAAAAALVVALGLSACADAITLQPADPAAAVVPDRTSRVLSGSGETIALLYGVENREDVALDDVADVLVQAVVAVEDRRFFTHGGVDLPGIVRAARVNLESGEVEQGGSTITQQLIKNTVTGDATTLERKVEEALLAWQLEQDVGKDEILERYLNTVYFGGGAYGIGAAARVFFGVEPSELTLDEAALLAGSIRSPSALDPRAHPDAALARRQVVLDALVRFGTVTRAEAEAAAATALDLAPPPTAEDERFGWFVDEVRRTIAADERFAALGSTPDARTDALLTGGLTVTTTIDPTWQRHAEEAVAQVLSEQGDPTAGVVVLDPGTGAVRAVVGGREDDGIVLGFSTATQAQRQPGSAFKPVVLSAALEEGVLLDRTYPGGACMEFPGVPGWEDGVCNYEGTVQPTLTLREATVRSVNTVYATLGVELGPRRMLEQARALGIERDLPAVHALALGAGEVTPFELAGAYAPFATLGMRHPVHLVERIVGPDGEVLYEHDPTPYRVIPEGVAHQVTATLTEVVGRGTGLRAGIGRPQAGKTGTSQDAADAWFVGYTPDLLAAVWVGFEEGRIAMEPPRTRQRVEGGRWPAEIWRALAEPSLASVPPNPFPQPEGGVLQVEVDVTRNCLPNAYTPRELIQVREYPADLAPTERCTEPAGPAQQDVPAVTGLPQEVAIATLEAEGFTVEVRPVAPQVRPTGVVELQRPGAGGTTREADGYAVVVWVSSATRVRQPVPTATGLDVDVAIEALEEGGWVVTLSPDRECDAATADCSPGRVTGQDPLPGTNAPQHDVIELTVVPRG